MPADNAEAVRRWVEAMNESPEAGAASVLELWDVDCNFYPVRKLTEARPCHGQEMADLITYLGAYTGTRWALEEVTEAGDDRLLAHIRVSVLSEASGFELEDDLYCGVSLRHRRILRMEHHLTLRGALHDLGLEGETLEEAGLVG